MYPIPFVVFFFSYKHAIDGFIRVWKEEGFRRLFSGVEMATSRAVLMTVGQLSFYDQVKQFLISTPYFSDNPTTHFLSSLTAVCTNTPIVFSVFVFIKAFTVHNLKSYEELKYFSHKNLSHEFSCSITHTTLN